MQLLASFGLAVAYYATQAQAGEAGPLPNCASGPLKLNKVCDITASPRERAVALVAAMQTSEKLANIVR